MPGWLRLLLVLCVCAAALPARAAPDPAQLAALASDDSDARVAAISALAAAADPRARPILKALYDGALVTLPGPGGTLVLAIDDGAQLVDAATGAPLPAAASRDPILANNRVRGAIDSALAALDLGATDLAVRRAAAEQLQGADDPALLPALERALTSETDALVRDRLTTARAALALRAPQPEQRLAAVRALAASDNPQVRQVLSALLAPDAEPDASVRAGAQAALAEINSRLRKYELASNLFAGLSLGSILLLAALGLAITFGLMGIINMAHGEFLMIGAYCTYLAQLVFQRLLPAYQDWYLLLALPFAFVITGLIGVALERGVIRWFYGRPLETLLATWGVSLLLIQTARSIFGAQNVEVANPAWMSGGIALAGGLVLPWNRIVIVLFALVVLVIVWALLNRTRMGLFVRAVTQNRAMASCTGVPTARVDMLTFGLGSGLAGLGGVALSQIGNVGPELGQGYIIDSFMVVVLGGVGQLAGTVIAALGLGALLKFMEPWSGAVLAKIFLLALIVLFIQKRPQGLFALKGRSAEA